MKTRTVASIIVLCLICGTIIPITYAKSLTNERRYFYGLVNEQAKYIASKFSHSRGALCDQPSTSIISTMTNSLAAATLFTEYNMGGSENLEDIAHGIVKTSSEYFRLDFHADRRGWVSSYDFTKEEESFVKSRKYTHDQFLMILGLANSYLNLNEEDKKTIGPDYLVDITDTSGFIEEYFLIPNEGWIDSVFTYNETRYTQNRFRLVENICWTIWASLNFPSDFGSPLTIEMITQMMDFLNANGTSNGAIYNVLSPDGSFTDHIFKLRTNTLYGIINLLLYEKANDLGISENSKRFLDRAEAIFNFLVANLWDRGFKLFYDAVDENGLLLVRGKSLIGNALACLLASRLCRYFPTNEAMKSIYILSDTFIDRYLKSSDEFKYFISCDRDGDPLSKPLTLDSNLIRLWQRSNTLHIVNGTYIDKVSIGEKIQIDLSLANPDNITYQILVTGDEIIPFNLTTSDSDLSVLITLKNNARIGNTHININVKVLNKQIDKTNPLLLKIGSDRRLPQGLVYLVALGILVCLVVLARYPPKNIEDILARLASIGVSEEPSDSDEPVDENTS
ncbi:MAG: hypothetical protein ACFE98_17285 [Candidatus Hermodarchaeota archaeon]